MPESSGPFRPRSQTRLRWLLAGCMELLQGSWVPLESPRTALGRLPGGSWQALGGFQEASWTKDRHIYNFLTIFRKIRKFGGTILATFYHQKLYFLRFQEGIQNEADFEGVLASILGRFLKARERQK